MPMYSRKSAMQSTMWLKSCHTKERKTLKMTEVTYKKTAGKLTYTNQYAVEAKEAFTCSLDCHISLIVKSLSQHQCIQKPVVVKRQQRGFHLTFKPYYQFESYCSNDRCRSKEFCFGKSVFQLFQHRMNAAEMFNLTNVNKSKTTLM